MLAFIIFVVLGGLFVWIVFLSTATMFVKVPVALIFLVMVAAWRLPRITTKRPSTS